MAAHRAPWFFPALLMTWGAGCVLADIPGGAAYDQLRAERSVLMAMSTAASSSGFWSMPAAVHGWESDQNPCDLSKFVGVVCDTTDKYVYQIDLQSRDIQCDPTCMATWNNLDFAAAGFNFVTSVDLSDNVLNGVFPESLLHMNSLRVLDLRYAGLTGPIADVNFSNAFQMTDLKLSGPRTVGWAKPAASAEVGARTALPTALHAHGCMPVVLRAECPKLVRTLVPPPAQATR